MSITKLMTVNFLLSHRVVGFYLNQHSVIVTSEVCITSVGHVVTILISHKMVNSLKGTRTRVRAHRCSRIYCSVSVYFLFEHI
jgi:hypothetical protein